MVCKKPLPVQPEIPRRDLEQESEEGQGVRDTKYSVDYLHEIFGEIPILFLSHHLKSSACDWLRAVSIDCGTYVLDGFTSSSRRSKACCVPAAEIVVALCRIQVSIAIFRMTK